MEQTTPQNQSPFATEPIGRLIAKFAIPCVISLLVNSLYNIVDQIFIGWGVGYLGNGATNVVFPITIVALFGSEEGLYNEFAVMAFRIFLLLCPLTGFQTVVAVYLQAVGKPIKSAILSLARQIIFFVPAALILPRFLGVTGVLWTGPVADGLAFLLSLGLLLYERSLLKKAEAAA